MGVLEVATGFRLAGDERRIPPSSGHPDFDPLLCPQCGGALRIMAFIERAEVIENILTDFGLWPAPAHSPPKSVAAQPHSVLRPNEVGGPGLPRVIPCRPLVHPSHPPPLHSANFGLTGSPG
jgi:hypothetical protein